MTVKKRELSQDLRDEAAALSELIHRYNEDRPAAERISGAKVAESLGITTTGFHHYLKGVNPLNLNVATRVAKMFGLKLSSFSPRLAEELFTLLELASVEDQPELPRSVSRSWFALNEKLALLAHTPIPGLPDLIQEIDADRAKIHKAIQQTLIDR